MTNVTPLISIKRALPIQSVLDANLLSAQNAAQQRRINADLDMLHDGDKGRNRADDVAWLMQEYAFENEEQAEKAYQSWLEDVT